MMENEILSGQQSSWCLINKLGEGDAGEVFLVESLVGGQTAILKRPKRSAFSGDLFRQTAQIRTESKILKALTVALLEHPDLGVAVPELLDQGKQGTDYNGKYFIVIGQAAGLDLAFLARITQMGFSNKDLPATGLTPDVRAFLEAIAKSGKIPDSILLTILLRLIRLLELIHTIQLNENGSETSGIVWNDVKPEHLFWNPQQSNLTVIDWGNARFLEADRTTGDRQTSWADDYRQFYDEMGRFLGMVAPDLKTRLNWPVQFSAEITRPDVVRTFKESILAALQDEAEGIASARAVEESLLQNGASDEISLLDIENLHRKILGFGEMPDFEGAVRFASGYAARLTREDRLDDLRKLCEWALRLPGVDQDQWRLIGTLAKIPGRSDGEQRRAFLDAIQAAICKDWEMLLWKVAAAIQGFPEPGWWQDLTALVRRLALGPEFETLRPLVGLNRFMYALQSASRRLEDLGEHPKDSMTTLEEMQNLAHRLTDDVIAAWSQLDPGPLDTGLSYKAVDAILVEARDVLPKEQQAVQALLNHPKIQVKTVLDAWEKKEFGEAAKGLRRLLLWDPDRRRVLRADQAVQNAREFLRKINHGPESGENLLEWVTTLEFRGRELRNQVGPAGWLDGILGCLGQIRRGVWPSDLFRNSSGILSEMPWLKRFDRVERVPMIDNEQEQTTNPLENALPEILGVQQGWLGKDASMELIAPLDAWMPEARGSSARVVSGRLLYQNSERREAAIKLMRMDKINYAMPLFKEEAQVLSLMRDIPGVAHMFECGFIQLEEGSQFPLDAGSDGNQSTGKVQRIGTDATQEYIERMGDMIEDGWTPYIAVEKEKQEDSLLLLCDAGMTRGNYLPMVTLLQMGIQICELLQIAHERNIVYRDHKILHYYWQAEKNGVYIIDWNVARYHAAGLTETDIHMDLVQFGARGLHHILTGRTAPGALPLGPTRPEEIEQAAETYQTQWTYDDQRLSPELRTVLERVLAGEFTSAADLGMDLKRTLIQMPDARL